MRIKVIIWENAIFPPETPSNDFLYRFWPEFCVRLAFPFILTPILYTTFDNFPSYQIVVSISITVPLRPGGLHGLHLPTSLDQTQNALHLHRRRELHAQGTAIEQATMPRRRHAAQF